MKSLSPTQLGIGVAALQLALVPFEHRVCVVVSAFSSPIAVCRRSRSSVPSPSGLSAHYGRAKKRAWSVADNWDDLSLENPANAAMDSAELFNQDPMNRAANVMHDEGVQAEPPSPEDAWIKDQIDSIMLPEELNAAFASTDSSSSSSSTTGGVGTDDNFDEEEMGTELSLLIRCNENPERMNIIMGRSLPPLTDAERFDVRQLVDEDGAATPFFLWATDAMFRQHAVPASSAGEAKKVSRSAEDDDAGKEVDKSESQLILDAGGVARWLQSSLGSLESVGRHDARINTIISKYGEYGTGFLTLENFRKAYMDTILGHNGIDPVTKSAADKMSWKQSIKRLGRQRDSEIQNVWRDLENHGILPPAQVEHDRLMQEMAQESAVAEASTGIAASKTVTADDYMIMDECEIVDETNLVPAARSHRHAKSSHELVELADDGETPLWIKDGQFGTCVFFSGSVLLLFMNSGKGAKLTHYVSSIQQQCLLTSNLVSDVRR